MLSIRDLLQISRYTQKVQGQKKIFYENRNEKKKAGVGIHMPDKIDFKTRAITRDKEGPSNFTSVYLSEEI